jgi:rubredoxin
MVGVRCEECGIVYKLAEDIPANLTCQVCGGTDISFTHKVKRRCLVCGHVEVVEKGEPCKTYHQKTPTSVREHSWIVKKVVDPAEVVGTVKKAYTKARRITKRRVAKGDGV